MTNAITSGRDFKIMMHQHTTQYAPIQPRPENVELNASQESENLDIGLPNDFVDENLEDLFGFGGHHLGNQYVQETATEIAEHPLVETPPPETLQSTLDFVSFQSSFFI